MAAFEVVKAIEGMSAPLDVRRDLRLEFGRWLLKRRHSGVCNDAEETIDERTLLELCEYYRLELKGDVENLEQVWNDSEPFIAYAL